MLVHTIRDHLSEFTYTALHAGLPHSIKPTKFGFQITAQGFSEKMPLLVSTMVAAIYKLDFTEAELNTVLEVHRKGLQSCAAEPLKNQSKYLLNALLRYLGKPSLKKYRNFMKYFHKTLTPPPAPVLHL